MLGPPAESVVKDYLTTAADGIPAEIQLVSDTYKFGRPLCGRLQCRRCSIILDEWGAQFRINCQEILDSSNRAGRVTHEQAEQHAITQYEKYDQGRRQLTDATDTDFDTAVKRLTESPPPKPSKQKKKKQADDKTDDGEK